MLKRFSALIKNAHKKVKMKNFNILDKFLLQNLLSFPLFWGAFFPGHLDNFQNT
jgi:hypothetical protein